MRIAQWLSVWIDPARRWVPLRGAGSIPVHSICSNVFTSFALFVGIKLDLGLWFYFTILTLSFSVSLSLSLFLSLSLSPLTSRVCLYNFLYNPLIYDITWRDNANQRQALKSDHCIAVFKILN